MKRGLIFERNSMANPYYSQGLPRIYAQLATNLVGLYDFSERTGFSVYNMAQNAFRGTIYPGATGNTQDQMWSNGSPGGIDTDGINDYVDFGDLIKTYCDYNKAFTFELWTTTGAYGTVGHCFNQLRQIGGTNGIYIQVYDYAAADKNCIFAMFQTGYTVGALRSPNPKTGITAASGVHHYVFTYSGASPYNGTCMEIYVDGAKPAGYTTGVYTNMSGTVWSGTIPVTQFGALDGTYNKQDTNKLAIYNRVITDLEALTLYNYEKQFIR